MSKKKFFTIITFIFILGLVGAPNLDAAKQKKKSSRGVTAKAAILSDATKVKRLYGRNVHRRVFPASTVKVMTGLLVLEKLPLEKVVTVSSRATGSPPSKIYLRKGEKYRVADLLYAILLSSANDASIVLAEAVAGSEAKFVRMMNQRAKRLGAQHTQFANATGLPSPGVSQYTTAYDMYLIFREALKHSFFRQAIRLVNKRIRSMAGRAMTLKSHNKILFSQNWRQKVYGKTGYTRAARACFIGTLKKGNSTLIIAVFGCTRRWDDIKHILTRYGGVTL